MKLRLYHLAIASLGLLLPGTAKAQSVQYNVSTLINGSAPPVATPTTPYLTALFQDAGANTVTLTLTDNSSSNATFVKDWLFNVTDPTTALTFTHSSGVTAISAAESSNAYDGGPQVTAGNFDIDFTFSSGGTHQLFGGQTSVYTITGTGINAAFFESLSVNPPNGFSGPQYTAADVAGFGSSGSVGTNTFQSNTSVPEPAFYQMSALMVLGGIGVLRLRRKARTQA